MTARDDAARDYDRTVHATDRSRSVEIARYDKTGKYRRETWAPDGTLENSAPLTLKQAVDLALAYENGGGTVHLRRPGGMRFDSEIRKARDRKFR